MSALLAYRCPHCHHTLQIEDDVMGEDMDCPVCGKPFKVDVPAAEPVETGELEPDSPEVHVAGREEEVVVSVHPAMFRKHPLRFLGEWAMVIGGLVLVGMAIGDIVYFDQTAQWIAGALLAGIGGLMLLHWWLTVLFTTFSITNKRTILRRGIISRFTSEVQHDDIRNIQVDQTMSERLLGAGDIAISSSGQDDLEVDVDGIPNPNKYADMIRGMQ